MTSIQNEPEARPAGALLRLWAYELRPRLISALRRPWTVGYFLVFAVIAFGGVDLGLGIARLRLDNPALGAFSPASLGDWIVLAANSAAFWTGLMLAASTAVVSSLVVYEWNIAPRRIEVDGEATFQFLTVDEAKCFREFLAMSGWIALLFTALWLAFNYADMAAAGMAGGSIARYSAGLALGAVLFLPAVRAAFLLLARMRAAFNEEDQRDAGRPPSLQAAIRQNLAGFILFAFVFLSAWILMQIGAVVPIAAIYLVLLIVYSAFKMLVYFTTLTRWAILVLTLVWLIYSGAITAALGLWSGPATYADTAYFNLQFPGFDADGRDFYAEPANLSAVNHYALSPAAATAAETRPSQEAGQTPSARFEAWADAYRAQHGQRPVLVIIATSGGAYRAGFWTGLVLDRFLDEAARPDAPLAGLAGSIRLITGASGGMVGASYFATRPADDPAWRSIARLEQDVLCAQMTDEALAALAPGVCPGALEEPYRLYPTRIPAPRQTLSAVAQHTLQHDLPSIFWGGRTQIDRGKVLEGQWLHLHKPVAFLGQEAFRPSMIFSPMIVETGQQLLISDLNLSGLEPVRRGEAVELFSHFPGTRDTLAIRTAVRMQATFPYITPAVSLPATGSYRVVDAGYYDNYGIVTAAAVLGDPDVMRILQTEFAAVLVLEVRAFPDTLEKTRSENDMAFDWLTTPLEAVLSARGNSMNFRNREVLRALQERYAAPTGHNPFSGVRGPVPIPVHRLVFTNCTETQSLNWFVPRDELEEMRASADAEWERNRTSLERIWLRVPQAKAEWGEGSRCP